MKAKTLRRFSLKIELVLALFYSVLGLSQGVNMFFIDEVKSKHGFSRRIILNVSVCTSYLSVMGQIVTNLMSRHV